MACSVTASASRLVRRSLPSLPLRCPPARTTYNPFLKMRGCWPRRFPLPILLSLKVPGTSSLSRRPFLFPVGRARFFSKARAPLHPVPFGTSGLPFFQGREDPPSLFWGKRFSQVNFYSLLAFILRLFLRAVQMARAFSSSLADALLGAEIMYSYISPFPIRSPSLNRITP